MTAPDYSRLVLVEHVGEGECYYYPHVGPQIGLCENCYFDAEPRTGEQVG